MTAKVFVSANRLMQNGVYVRNFYIGHGRIKGEIIDRVFDILRDRMRLEISFERNFDVVSPGRYEWLESWPNSLPKGGIVSFTG